MKIKNLFALSVLLLPLFFISAKTIDQNTAQSVARNFLLSKIPSQKTSSIQLIRKVVASTTFTAADKVSTVDSTSVCYYVFSGPGNFVLVAGTDNVTPVLGYSTANSFCSEVIPVNLKNWLEMYQHEIQYAIDNHVVASDAVRNQWKVLSSGESTSATVVVAPLLKTSWDQSPYYNALCPFDNVFQQNTLAGCGAIAMAQVLKYWNYPTHGMGSHSYVPLTNPQYGTLTADFQNTTYDWASMPNSISSSNLAVATLIYHCGISIDMDYGVYSSSAYSRYNNHPSTYIALKDVFGYKSTLNGVSQSSYTATAWGAMIKTDLKAGRPVLYRGAGDSGGHLFVCDGYDSNNYYHFNWGWSGYFDGYFTLSALSPGSSDFSIGQYAIFGVEPKTVNPTVDMRLDSKIAISPATQIKPAAAFSITACVKNFGGAPFTGILCAGLYNSSGTLMTTFGSQAVTLAANESTGSISFSSTGIANMVAGTYSIHLFHKQDGKTSYSMVAINIDLEGTNNNTLAITFSDSNYSLVKDTCESNDTEATAYEIKPVFKNDTATILTSGMNLDALTDLDYYKINLPEGYHYTVSSYLNSAYTDTAFTADAKYSCKMDNNPWTTAAIFDVFPFEYNGNGSVYFKVEPITSGNPGTYALAASIIRQAKPNLKPYMPSTWDDIIVLNKTRGSLSSAPVLSSNDSIYLNVAHINNGEGYTNKSYFSPVFLDGKLLVTWNVSTLPPYYYNYYINVALGKLSEGEHTIKFTVDATNQIDETDETDNEYMKTFIVYAPTLAASPTQITLPASTSNTSVDVKSDLNWNVKCDQPWVTLDKKSGVANQTINIHILENTLPDARISNIVLMASDNTSQTVVLTQEGQNTAVKTVNATDFVVSPNPSNGQFTVKIPSDFQSNSSLTIIDNTANEIKKLMLIGGQTQKINLNVPSGTYLIELNNGKKRIVSQIIITN